MYKVSFIVSSFNKVKFISFTIDSVLSQNYANIELIVVDDCSDDGSRQLLEEKHKNNQHNFFLFLLSENKGANYCRNYGLKQAKGDFVIFLDADDIVSNNCANDRIDFMTKNQGLDFSVFSMGVFKHQVDDLSSGSWVPNSVNPLVDFLSHKIPWSIMQPIWKRSVLVSVCGFDENFLRLQDVELHTRLLFNENLRYAYSNKIDCYYRIDEHRSTYNRFDFFQRVVISVEKYFLKFYPLAKEKQIEKALLGTLIKVYIQIVLALKSKEISKDEFLTLERQLTSNLIFFSKAFFYKLTFKLTRYINLFPLKIKGVNWLLEKLIRV